jgi:hypothetical protein
MSNKSSAVSTLASSDTNDVASSDVSHTSEAPSSGGHDSGISLKTSTALTDSLRAYELVKPEVALFPREQAATINADIGSMTQSALWGMRQVEAYKELIKRDAPTYDLNRIEKIRLLALALNYLQARHRFLKEANKTEAPAELIALRDQLRKGIDFLISRGFVPEERLSKAALTTGHHAIAYNVIAFVEILAETADEVGTPPYWSRAELEDIRRKADAFFDALGDKEFGPDADAELKLARRKVFAMLGMYWNDLYELMRYIRRREKDVDSIMPTLYPPRPGRRSATPPAEQRPAASASNGSIDTVDTDSDEDDDGEDDDASTLDFAAINAAAMRAPNAPNTGEPVPPGFPGARPLRSLESK